MNVFFLSLSFCKIPEASFEDKCLFLDRTGRTGRFRNSD